MKSIIGIYDTHEKAMGAITQLQNAGYPVEQAMIIGQGEIVDGLAQIKSSLTGKEVGIGAAVGSILGILNGVGIFAMPGLGFVFGWGAVISGSVGLVTGVLVGGVVAILTSIGIEAAKYEHHLEEGKFMLIIRGSGEAIDLARSILETHGQHLELNENESLHHSIE